jgi:hypothetical protein
MAEQVILSVAEQDDGSWRADLQTPTRTASADEVAAMSGSFEGLTAASFTTLRASGVGDTEADALKDLARNLADLFLDYHAWRSARSATPTGLAREAERWRDGPPRDAEPGSEVYDLWLLVGKLAAAMAPAGSATPTQERRSPFKDYNG